MNTGDAATWLMFDRLCPVRRQPLALAFRPGEMSRYTDRFEVQFPVVDLELDYPYLFDC